MKGYLTQHQKPPRFKGQHVFGVQMFGIWEPLYPDSQKRALFTVVYLRNDWKQLRGNPGLSVIKLNSLMTMPLRNDPIPMTPLKDLRQEWGRGMVSSDCSSIVQMTFFVAVLNEQVFFCLFSKITFEKEPRLKETQET